MTTKSIPPIAGSTVEDQYRDAVQQGNVVGVYHLGQDLLKQAGRKAPLDVRTSVLLAAAQLGQSATMERLLNELREELGSDKAVQKVGPSVSGHKPEDVALSAKYYKSTLEQDPADTASRHGLLTLAAMQGPVDSSVLPLLAKSVGEVPMDGEVWTQLVRTLVAVGRVPEARLAAEEVACVLNPRNDGMLGYLADIAYAMGSDGAAASYFGVLTSVRPTQPRALWGFLQAKHRAQQDNREDTAAIKQRLVDVCELQCLKAEKPTTCEELWMEAQLRLAASL